jgi:hypothetical protein
MSNVFFYLQDCTSTARYHQPLSTTTAILTHPRSSDEERKKKKKEIQTRTFASWFAFL